MITIKAVDSIGREILDLTDAPIGTQVQAWNNSALKTEFLELFPDFSEMKIFVEERVRGDALKAKLTDSIDDAESQYLFWCYECRTSQAITWLVEVTEPNGKDPSFYFCLHRDRLLHVC